MAYKLVQGDTGPQEKITLVREDTGLPVDLREATTLFKFRRKGTDTVLTTLTSVSSAADAENGIALFAWNPGDLDVPAGLYEAEVEITFNASGYVETVFEVLDYELREDF